MTEADNKRLASPKACRGVDNKGDLAASPLHGFASAMDYPIPSRTQAKAVTNSFHNDPYQLAAVYLAVKSFVLEAGFEAEIDHQEECSLARIGEPDFLREGAWVILSSGMRESVIRAKFPGVSAAFGQWRSAAWISQRATKCRRGALAIFSHAGKVEAIINLARRVCASGINEVLRQVSTNGIEYLRTFTFMGPATSYHFAKNIGLDVVKPDRHLVRVSKVTGFDTPWDLCKAIGDLIGEKPSVVDLVIWRYATIRHDYLDLFAALPQCVQIRNTEISYESSVLLDERR